MSTKSTLSHNKNYHLYEECFDKSDFVYLQIDDPVELEMYLCDGSTKSVTVAIPIEACGILLMGG